MFLGSLQAIGFPLASFLILRLPPLACLPSAQITLRVLRHFLNNVEDPNLKHRGSPQVNVNVCLGMLNREYKTFLIKLPRTATVAHLRVEIAARVGVASNLVSGRLCDPCGGGTHGPLR